MGPSIEQVRREIVSAGHRLWQRGLVGGSEGNVSVRVEGGRLVTTPSGACKGFLEPDDLVVTDLDGRPLGTGRPSSELKMHVAIYSIRADVRAVVHAHPPTATGFAIAGEAFDECVVPEVIATLGRVPLVPYGTPSTPELPERIAPWVPTHDALLLANHGAVTYAATLARAIDVMESLEQAARSLLTARMLGRVRRLSRDEVDRLVGLDAYGIAVRNPGCTIADPEPLGDRPAEGPAARQTGTTPRRGEPPERDAALREKISTIVQETLEGGPP